MSAPRSPLADTVCTSATASAPTVGAAIATIAAPGVGDYYIRVLLTMSGTAETATANAELRHGATVVGKCGTTSITNTQLVEFERVAVAAGEAITVNATAGATAGAIYNVSIQATRIG